MTRRLFSACVTALALLALLPLAARAADTVVDFSAVPAGTELVDQYGNVGVRFNQMAAFRQPPPPAYSCGVPVVGDNGINGRSAAIACKGIGEFEGAFNAAFGFDEERRAVRFRLKSMFAGGPEPVDISIHAINGQTLESRVVGLPQGVPVEVRFGPRAAAEIASVRIAGRIVDAPTGQVYLDDIVAPIELVMPPPKFSLSLPRPLVEVVEGSSVDVPVAVQRYNGSTGPVAISVPALPPGIAGTVVTPNPLSGRDPATMRITASSPLTGDRQVAVTAAAAPGAPVSVGTAVAPSGVVTVRGVSALQIYGNVNPETLVPRCTGPLSGSFSVRGGYSGNVRVSADTLTGPVTPGAPSNVRVSGDGVANFSLPLTSVLAGPAVVRVTLTPDGATPVSAEYRTNTVPVNVSGLGADTVPETAGAIGVLGQFPLSCPLRFVDDGGREYPVIDRGVTDDGRDRLVLRTPAGGPVNAPSGLRVLAPDGTQLTRTPPLRVNGFRNTWALRQANSGMSAGSTLFPWDDFVATWGDDDAYVCFIGCVRDPIAVDYWERWIEDVKSNQGLCYGWTTMALRFRGIQSSPLSPAAYEPGAQRAWDITNFADPARVKRDVVRYHYTQFDRTLQPTLANPVPGPGSMAARVAEWKAIAKAAVARDGGVMTTFWNSMGTGGHAVVAHRVTDRADGGFDLALSDPNAPYTAAEETNPTARTNAIAANTITVTGAGTWSGSSLNWSGDLNRLAFAPILPLHNATLPTNFSLASMFSAGGAAAITSIRSRGDEALAADGTGKAGSGVTLRPGLDGAAPTYVLERGRSYDLTVSGRGSGGYGVGGLGDGANAIVTGIDTKLGQRDRVTLLPGRAQLGFEPGGDSAGVRYSLVEAPSRTVRQTADIETRAPRGAADVASLSGGELSVVHRGAPATLAITLGSLGRGLPGSVQLAPLRVGRDQRIALKPRSWKDLNEGVGLVVRTARGRVVRRGTARLRPTRAVALAALGGTVRGRSVTVSGRVGKRGAAPVLAVRVEALGRGGRVTASRTASLRGAQVPAGRFSLPVALPRSVSRGARVRVVATLLDEAAGLASVRRTAVIRAR